MQLSHHLKTQWSLIPPLRQYIHIHMWSNEWHHSRMWMKIALCNVALHFLHMLSLSIPRMLAQQQEEGTRNPLPFSVRFQPTTAGKNGIYLLLEVVLCSLLLLDSTISFLLLVLINKKINKKTLWTVVCLNKNQLICWDLGGKISCTPILLKLGWWESNERAISAVVPNLWNSLPLNVCSTLLPTSYLPTNKEALSIDIYWDILI